MRGLLLGALVRGRLWRSRAMERGGALPRGSRRSLGAAAAHLRVAGSPGEEGAGLAERERQQGPRSVSSAAAMAGSGWGGRRCPRARGKPDPARA